MTQFVFVVLSGLLRAVVISCLWGWFLHPLGAPHLQNLWHAIGISGFISLFTADFHDGPADQATRSKLSKTEQDSRLYTVITASFLFHGAVLFFSWLTHFFMVKP